MDRVADRYELRAPGRSPVRTTPAYRELRAYDREVDVEVALWLFHPDLVPDEERRVRFVAGAAELRRLADSHLLRSFDAGLHGETVYVTAQPSEADPLMATLGAGHEANDVDLLHYATCVGQALGALHAAGVVHGRLVPDDIVQVAGLIKLAGAGLVREVDPIAAAHRWQAHERYLAPEVRRGAALSPAADTYSLAVILSELATGHRLDELRAQLGRVAARNPDLYRVLQAALDDVPERRSTTVAELVHHLGEVLAGALVDSREAGAAEPDPTRHYLPAAPPRPDTVDHEMLEDEPGSRPPTDADATRNLRKVRTLTGDAELAGEETVLDEDGAPVGEPPPPIPRPTPAARPRVVSMKPATEPGTRKPPVVAAADRPELKPRVRPLASMRRTPSQDALGRYAPPRDAQAGRPGGSRWLWWLLGGVSLALVAALAVWLVMTSTGSPPEPAPAPSPPVPTTPAPAPVVTPAPGPSAAPSCPDEMVPGRVGEHAYCIDRYESPGRGRLPETGVDLERARRSCARRGARLCTSEEWEAACRGRGGASWPYGSAFRRGVCNTGARGAIAPTGSFEACISAIGAHDMSGNVAEWTADGETRGGSALDASDGRCSKDPRRNRTRGYSDVGFRCCSDVGE